MLRYPSAEYDGLAFDVEVALGHSARQLTQVLPDIVNQRRQRDMGKEMGDEHGIGASCPLVEALLMDPIAASFDREAEDESCVLSLCKVLV